MKSEANPPSEDTQNKVPASRTAPGIALRIILVLITGAVLGGALYFGASGWIPYLDQRVFQPIENNQQAAGELQQTQRVLAAQLGDLAAAVEQNQSNTALALGGTLSALEAQLAQLEEDTSSLQDRVVYAATQIPAQLATAQAQRDSISQNLSALATAQRIDASGQDELELLRIMELFSRANQFLLHDNYGLAEDELTTARDHLTALAGQRAPQQEALVQELLGLVQGAISDLPGRPAQATLKLELAWQLVLDGFPSAEEAGALTPTPSPASPTPSPN